MQNPLRQVSMFLLWLKQVISDIQSTKIPAEEMRRYELSKQHPQQKQNTAEYDVTIHVLVEAERNTSSVTENKNTRFLSFTIPHGEPYYRDNIRNREPQRRQ